MVRGTPTWRTSRPSRSLNVRLERAGRPEVPNLMLAPKQFDPVNRDLEIRDLYNT